MENRTSSAISIKAIAVGSVIDIGISMLVGVVYTFFYMILLASDNVPAEEMQRRILADPSYYIITVVIGLVGMGLGGYVAARIARAREIMHSFWVGVVAIGFSLLLIAPADTSMYPVWYMPVAFGLTLPAAVVGGYIAQRRAPAKVEVGAA